MSWISSNSVATFFFVLPTFCLNFIPVLWDFVLGSIFDLFSPKFTLKKLSTSSLGRGFRILHTRKGPCWPESHEANDYIGHILVFLWLHHTDPPGTTDQSGFMVTLTTNQISHFTPVWIFWLMTQFILTLHILCNCAWGVGQDGWWERPVHGTMLLGNYPFKKQTDNFSLVFSYFSTEKCFLLAHLEIKGNALKKKSFFKSLLFLTRSHSVILSF